MTQHRVAVLYGSCTVRSLFETLSKVLKEITDTLDYAEGHKISGLLKTWETELAANPDSIEPILRSMFAGVLEQHPVLLVLDDFEQSIEKPSRDVQEITPVSATRPVLAALLSAFAATDTRSRLLITSRYDFTLPIVDGSDPAQALQRVALKPMETRDRKKQVQAKAREAKAEARLAERSDLAMEALEAAAGNPGLQDVLTMTILNGEEAAARAAIDQIMEFRESGVAPPEDSDLGDFFTRMAFDRYAEALTPTQATALGAAQIFSQDVPIPLSALHAVIGAAGVADPQSALARLMALGLVDDWGDLTFGTHTEQHAAVNPLARRLGTPVQEADEPHLCDAGFAALAKVWHDKDGAFPFDPRGLEASRIGSLAQAPAPECLDAAATAGVIHLLHTKQDFREALKLGKMTLARLSDLGHQPGPMLMGKMVNAAATLGEVALLDELLEGALSRSDLDHRDRGQFLGLLGERQQASGEIAAAGQSYSEAEKLFRAAGDKWSIAITRGKVADILMMQGKLAEAYRIREKEELPVYEALGDKRSIAIARGEIADILMAQGDLIEARRIREEQLPVYEALGDKRSIAATRGKLADILMAQGNLAQARRIREEEELPVYEALGDKQAIVVTRGKIAQMLTTEGHLDEALEMHLSRLPDAKSLRDADSVAHIRFSCAQIRLTRGDHERGGIQTIYDELDEAFRIYFQIGKADGIAYVGNLLGQLLNMGGHWSAGIAVLRQARDAFAKLGKAERVAECDDFIRMIEEMKDDEN